MLTVLVIPSQITHWRVVNWKRMWEVSRHLTFLPALPFLQLKLYILNENSISNKGLRLEWPERQATLGVDEKNQATNLLGEWAESAEPCLFLQVFTLWRIRAWAKVQLLGKTVIYPFITQKKLFSRNTSRSEKIEDSWLMIKHGKFIKKLESHETILFELFLFPLFIIFTLQSINSFPWPKLPSNDDVYRISRLFRRRGYHLQN